MFLITVGFVLGVFTIVVFEILGLWFWIRLLSRKAKDREIKHPSREQVHGDHWDLSYPNKQGIVWVLEVEKIPKNWFTDKGSTDQKRKKEILEVNPVRKYANLKDQLLTITEPDRSYIIIRLKYCTISAVSATNLPSRKWAKRYPIKVESTSVIYHESKSLYIYLDTSLEKESWCKALRMASCGTNEKLKSYSKLRSQFRIYLTTLNSEHPSLMKPTLGSNSEAIDRLVKVDNSSSKVRTFLKKIAKKNSKGSQESVSVNGSVKPGPVGKAHNLEENGGLSTFTDVASRSSNISGVSDADFEDKFFSDEGTLCWNLLLSRLFFDAKSNSEIKSFLQARIQRSLSNMRSLSYIGEVICTGMHFGNLPPYIHGMKVLPSDMNDALALEIDIEYRGGAVLDIATRVEVCDIDLSEGVGPNLEPTTEEEVTSDLLEGFENFGNQLKMSQVTAEKPEEKDEGDSKIEKPKSFKGSIQGSASASRWRSIVNSVAKQVSQVPLTLGIRVASLRGTLRLEIKAPPSDQMWFAFTSMPDIDLNLESSVGDHKITSGRIALFLINRFKAAIRESMVLPNFESIYIPFMLAEKDDWLPRQAAPFIWVNQEPVTDSSTVHVVPGPQLSEATRISEARRKETHRIPESTETKVKKVENFQQPTKEPSLLSPVGPSNQSTQNEKPLEELKTPLLAKDESEGCSQSRKEESMGLQASSQESRSTSGSTSWSLSLTANEENHVTSGDDAKQPNRLGSTRAKMRGLGKKMGEKFEEKRRHIEEKGRNIVEKMRGPQE